MCLCLCLDRLSWRRRRGPKVHRAEDAVPGPRHEVAPDQAHVGVLGSARSERPGTPQLHGAERREDAVQCQYMGRTQKMTMQIDSD